MVELNKVLKFIDNEEKCVRDYIAKYYIDGKIGTIELTKKLVELLKTEENEDEKGKLLSYISDLPIDEEILSDLLKLDFYNDNEKMYLWFHIDNIIAHGDINVLSSLDISPRIKENIEIYIQRKELANMDTQSLWNKLWEHSKSGDSLNLSEYKYGFGNIIIKELAKREDFPYEKLEEKINNNIFGSKWDKNYICSLIGKLKYANKIDFLEKNYMDTIEYLKSEIEDALISISNNDAVEILKKLYIINQNKEDVIKALSSIKINESEKTLISLYSVENNTSNKVLICDGLCKLFSKEAIEIVKNEIERGYNKTLANLEEGIFVISTINELEEEKILLWKEEMKYKFVGNKMDISKIIGQNGRKMKIGRNDICPCGSNIKYKKCCGK